MMPKPTQVFPRQRISVCVGRVLVSLVTRGRKAAMEPAHRAPSASTPSATASQARPPRSARRNGPTRAGHSEPRNSSDALSPMAARQAVSGSRNTGCCARQRRAVGGPGKSRAPAAARASASRDRQARRPPNASTAGLPRWRQKSRRAAPARASSSSSSRTSPTAAGSPQARKVSVRGKQRVLRGGDHSLGWHSRQARLSAGGHPGEAPREVGMPGLPVWHLAQGGVGSEFSPRRPGVGPGLGGCRAAGTSWCICCGHQDAGDGKWTPLPPSPPHPRRTPTNRPPRVSPGGPWGGRNLGKETRVPRPWAHLSPCGRCPLCSPGSRSSRSGSPSPSGSDPPHTGLNTETPVPEGWGGGGNVTCAPPAWWGGTSSSPAPGLPRNPGKPPLLLPHPRDGDLHPGAHPHPLGRHTWPPNICHWSRDLSTTSRPWKEPTSLTMNVSPLHVHCSRL
ncbi:translation initiation factor IF-2-like [Tachyglossus aculeatus]|uniref:translation initiation factor IF-2-like n=1 Tax=Tachyglossus aculeatus TaxID=9261 RepID=UPI0018F2D18F|nr:translation initiation factor IF-2-like [Tachyglossus aculeatus]